MDIPSPSEIFPHGPDGAPGLRKQAAVCRRLAAQAQTRAGATSMTALADHFDEQARRLELVKATGDVDKRPGTQKAKN